MGGTCRTHGRDGEMSTAFGLEIMKGRYPLDDLRVGERIILEWVFEE
jgi:hypothetical protein